MWTVVSSLLTLALLWLSPQAMADLDWKPEFGLLDGLKDSYSKDFGRGTFRKVSLLAHDGTQRDESLEGGTQEINKERWAVCLFYINSSPSGGGLYNG